MKGKSNPVAKHLRTFNKATVQRDRKKDSKLGKKNKYKKDIYKEDGDLEKARDNVGRDSCWDGYKAKDTKMKNGKMVPDCKKESSCEGDSSERKTKSLRALRFEYKTKYKNEARIDPTDGKSTSRDSSVKQVKSKADFMKGRKDTRKKPRLSHKEEVDEGLAVKSGNESGGYYNASYNIKHGKNEPKTKEDYVKTHAVIKKMTGGKDSQIKDYLDSKRGRHLVGKEQDKLYVKKDFSKWIRSYNPDDYRWESVEQVDEISQGMKNRYLKRASMSAASNAHSDGIALGHGNDAVQKKHKKVVMKRLRGIGRATKESSEDFTPHDMFDPKTGEKKRAETLDMHLALKAKGWGHSKNESVEQVDEGFFKSLKNNFSDGMRSEVKKSIDPKHLDKYNIDSAKSVGDIKNILKKAKSAGHMKESVEQVDEGLMNDIRDFIVAVGASLPTKKNKKARTDKTLEDQVRYAMQADPEFDKLVRNVVSVRKDGVAAFRNGGKEALQKYVAKTVDAEAAKKLGTLQTRWMKVKKDGSVGKATSNTYGKKFKDEKDDPTKHKNVEDMYLTHIATTEKIGKIIKQVAVRAQREAQQEKKRSSKPLSAVRFKKESVEHLDEFNRIMHFKSDLNFKINPKWTAKEIDSEIKKMTADVKKFAILTKNRKHGWDTNKMPDDQWKRKDYLRKLIWHKKNGIKESVEQVDELTQREKEMIADRKAKRMSKSGRKDRNTRLLPKTTTYVRPSKGEDDHIVMQLRKAQDSANFGNGEFDIRVSPVKGAATVSLKKPQIDKLLAVHDKLEKPDQKRKYRITLLKTLRSMQQKKK